ncbi:OmpH family outer membrane protein [Jannaschia aquimarina]|uniref:Outer membrane protein (OmpH-like) n=1 Tax=Jannaschia aquimarina TaxID=935700 RepID=A0A0D1EGE9_9RHOB|nr:OmpH family outer membrane protein [Jannaschia aquimarina]KIT16001.1 Outer membrane protein (OmpH-like) [Jannaschia aquimarina]SNS99765.1 periplasmic chaperone for outer membrane proteins Skp [Jannaschia aquimarina]
MHRRGVLAGLAAWIALPGHAQGQDAIAVLDRDALFPRSAFGQRILREIEAETAELGAENRRIEAELEAEELTLTERRKEMEPGEFRLLAQAFDTRVEGIRRTQDAKARAIQAKSDRAQQVFLERVRPILGALIQEAGVQILLDRRFVIASAEGIDITQAALRRIDAELGEGHGLEDPSGTEETPAPVEEATDP